MSTRLVHLRATDGFQGECGHAIEAGDEYVARTDDATLITTHRYCSPECLAQWTCRWRRDGGCTEHGEPRHIQVEQDGLGVHLVVAEQPILCGRHEATLEEEMRAILRASTTDEEAKV